FGGEILHLALIIFWKPDDLLQLLERDLRRRRRVGAGQQGGDRLLHRRDRGRQQHERVGGKLEPDLLEFGGRQHRRLATYHHVRHARLPDRRAEATHLLDALRRLEEDHVCARRREVLAARQGLVEAVRRA